MLEIRELTMGGVVLSILVATVLGGVIGLERGLKNRAAGLRTYILVCLGACVVMLINQYAYQVYETGDPVRLGAQVVSGIGFLGAGTIIVTRHNQIKGLTTAAGLWTSACIGLAVGIGFYEAAVVSAIVVFLVLTVLHSWDDFMRSRTHRIEVYLELDNAVPLGSLIRAARDKGIELTGVQREHEAAYLDGAQPLLLTARGKKLHQDEMIHTLRKLDGVRNLEVL